MAGTRNDAFSSRELTELLWRTRGGNDGQSAARAKLRDFFDRAVLFETHNLSARELTGLLRTAFPAAGRVLHRDLILRECILCQIEMIDQQVRGCLVCLHNFVVIPCVHRLPSASYVIVCVPMTLITTLPTAS